jgi:hypothetical protein
LLPDPIDLTLFLMRTSLEFNIWLFPFFISRENYWLAYFF